MTLKNIIINLEYIIIVTIEITIHDKKNMNNNNFFSFNLSSEIIFVYNTKLYYILSF